MTVAGVKIGAQFRQVNSCLGRAVRAINHGDQAFSLCALHNLFNRKNQGGRRRYMADINDPRARRYSLP